MRPRYALRQAEVLMPYERRQVQRNVRRRLVRRHFPRRKQNRFGPANEGWRTRPMPRAVIATVTPASPQMDWRTDDGGDHTRASDKPVPRAISCSSGAMGSSRHRGHPEKLLPFIQFRSRATNA